MEGKIEEASKWRVSITFDVESFINSGAHFTDAKFPASKNSLTNHDGSKKEKDWNGYTWKSTKDIFHSHEYSIFSGIEPNDIEQGSLGNCYFLSALSSLAFSQHRITKLFLTDRVNGCELYVIMLFITGRWIRVTLDNMFPYNPHTKSPAFSKSKERELWVLLVEKGWAKVHGTYENTISGNAESALHALTGAPCKYIFHEDVEKEMLWSEMVNAVDMDFVICAGAGQDHLSREELEKRGLVSAHEYGVMWVKEILYMKNKVKLLQIRNPWGEFEWKGDWSDQSKLWTPQLKNELNFVEEDDGLFFMNYEDYLKYFRTTTICQVHDDYIQNSYTVEKLSNEFCGSGCILGLTVRESTLGYFSASQLEKRIMRLKYPLYKYSSAGLVLSKLDDHGKYTYLKHTTGSNYLSSLHFDPPLTPGFYVIFINIDWKFEGLESLTFNTYTDKPVEVSLLYSDGIDRLGGLQNIKYIFGLLLIEMATFLGRAPQQLKRKGEFIEIKIYNVPSDFGYYVVLANRTADVNIEIDLKYELDNLRVEDEVSSELKIRLEGGEVVVKRLVIIDDMKGYKYKTAISYTFI